MSSEESVEVELIPEELGAPDLSSALEALL
jgi:hypothetical protein